MFRSHPEYRNDVMRLDSMKIDRIVAATGTAWVVRRVWIGWDCFLWSGEG